MDGIVPLYKPRGMTSHDCVSQLRKILHMKKIGHSGTLDPDVDGVLPICIGEATKVVELLVAGGKTYQGAIRLGFATTTEDLSGEVIATKKVETRVNDDLINQTLTEMTGKIMQIPPMYSAVKVNGRKLYEYARAGETVERPKREIEISRFEQRKPSEYDARLQQQEVFFTVDCSKGTYVRTLAVDFGAALGFPAVMSDLTRLASGGFTLDQTLTFEQISNAMVDNTLPELLMPIESVYTDLPVVNLTTTQWAKVQNGAFFKPKELGQTASKLRLYQHHVLKAVYELQDGNYRPDKMFLTNEGLS